ncbi:MAG: hypothetical protein NC209_02665 [Alistipes sp.]|nr:hypothetical protein [Alistipes senegalensis]MCM1250031.1 hypothetical protein [Alistipes sp.]MCM1352395.1 hypothetical protein [Alistipes senegalensis]
MARRRYISLMLLAVYLLATGGAWMLSLSCRCQAERQGEHLCCVAGHHVGHDHDAAAEELCATCTCDRHSTEIALYTASQDDLRECRCAVLALPHCLAAAQAARLAAPKFRKERIAEPAYPLPQAPCLRISSLRAPPASV